MEEAAKVPDDTLTWDALDIFVFSNGQQNSPPRKYHLRLDDLSWWKSTLKYLGKSQYGSASSLIDLYTIEGKKVRGPLELSHGTFYVAVEPSKEFIDAGYEKYLIKASRSWEKRQAQRNDIEKVIDECGIVTSEINPNIQPEVKANIQSGEYKMKTQEESVLLNTIISSVVENESSLIVTPQPVTPGQKSEAQPNVTTVKTVEKKRISIQRPTSVRKLSPNLPNQPLVSNIKAPIKKSGLKPTTNVTISKPENEGGNKSRLLMKSKISKATKIPKEPPIPERVVSTVHQTLKEVKTSSVKVNKNGQSVLSETAKISNVHDKEEMVVSNVYKNPHKETPSITVESHVPDLHDTRLFTSQFNTNNENNEHKDAIIIELRNNTINSNETTCNKSHNFDPEESLQEHIITDAMSNLKFITSNIEPSYPHYVNCRQSDSYKNSQVRDFVPEGKRENNVDAEINNMKLGDLSSTKDSILPKSIYPNTNSNLENNPRSLQIYKNNQPHNNTPKEQYEHGVIAIKNDNISHNLSSHKILILPTYEYEANHKQNGYPSNDAKSILITNSKPTMSSIANTSVTDHLSNERYVNQKVDNNINKNDIKQINTLNNNDKNEPLSSTNLNDEYVAVLNKGDTINLKLNIEIKKDGNATKRTDNVKTDTNAKEKASQINIISNTIVENRSLVSLIVREVEKHRKEDNPNVIIVQCKGCKYCAENVVSEPCSISKNDIIIPPLNLVESSGKRFSVSYSEHENSIINPLKAVSSCVSLERLTTVTEVNVSIETTPQNVTINESLNESIVEKIKTDKDITKKSVLISNTSIAHNFNGETENFVTNKEFMEPRKLGNTKENHFSQTEWCNLLLEAKLEDDGHYTFCLPSLRTLKNCKLL